MYLGRYQLGQRVPITILVLNGSGSQASPNDAPVYEIWKDGTTKVEVGKLYQQDDSQEGLFGKWLRLGSSYSSGYYQVIVRYDVLGAPEIKFRTFAIVGGGDAGGAVHSLYFWRRPEADYVIGQTDAGEIFQGRGPEI